MLVMKFGGSSLANAAQLDKARQIVAARAARRPVVVCSAHKGITDLLIAAASDALEGKPNASPIIDRQQQIVADVGAPPQMLAGLYRELEDLLRGISLVREVSPRVFDFVQSFGERLSVRTIAHYFRAGGLKAKAFDAFDLGFVTDRNFGIARPVEGYEDGVRQAFARSVADDEIPIVTGFVGKTVDGEITTVGRNGSDFSATCFAAALNAEECQIWTDTDGVMTADPSLIRDARNIPTMSFAEASELARYGGRVLHPSTLLPAVKRKIPVRVLNTNRPEHPGTVITEAGGDSLYPITSIAYKEGQSVFTIESTQMLGQSGFLARVFDVFRRYEIDLDMISTSSVTVSMTCDPVEDVEAVIQELEAHGRVSLAQNKTIVCIVGKNVKHQIGLGGRIFGALSSEGVNVEMITHGANNINLSLLVDDAQIDDAIRALHASLFAKSSS